MPECRLPTTPEQWAAVEVMPQDDALYGKWCKGTEGTDAPKIAAASRLLGWERCVAALAKWMEDGMPMTDDDSAEVEARRILEDAK